MRKKKKSKRLSFTLGAQTNYAANLPVIKTFQQSQSCVRDGGGGDLFGWECDPASILISKKKKSGTPHSLFSFFFLVSLSLTCTHYNVSCPFFPTGNQSAEGGKVWHVLRPETIQLGTRLAFAGGPFNIILSRLDLILFFLNCLLIWRILRRCSPMVNITEMVRPEQQEIFLIFLPPHPTPLLLAVRVL